MVRLGIIGSDNSHGPSVAHVCNILKKVSMRVTHIWGETEMSVAEAAQKGAIPHIVHDWREFVGKVDGVMVNHRHGGDHFEAADFFVKKRIPVFVDKPISDDLATAKKLFARAGRHRTPLGTFGVLPLQKVFLEFSRTLRNSGKVIAVNTTGPADIDSPYGGIFFYGFHQIDVIVDLLGTNARSVMFQRSGKNGVASIRFSDGRIASLNCMEKGIFHWTACTSDRVFSATHRYDEVAYLRYTRKLQRLVSAGEISMSVPRMLAPIAILEALRKAVSSGLEQKVARLGP